MQTGVNSQVLDVLQKARELISDEKRWTKGDEARCENGIGIYPTSPLAVCWCARGAVSESSKDMEIDVFRASMAFLHDESVAKHYAGVVSFNDSIWSEHHDIVELFDKAIVKVKEKIDGGMA